LTTGSLEQYVGLRGFQLCWCVNLCTAVIRGQEKVGRTDVLSGERYRSTEGSLFPKNNTVKPSTLENRFYLTEHFPYLRICCPNCGTERK